jgi:hypothetical protein
LITAGADLGLCMFVIQSLFYWFFDFAGAFEIAYSLQ